LCAFITFAISSFELQVFSKPNLVMETTYSICQGVPITIDAPSGFSSYNWSNGSNSTSTTIFQQGTYTLTVTQNHGLISCNDSTTITVLNSNIATITQVETADWTETENSITVIADGDGDYEYSLDGLTYQESNNFYGLISGEYTVYVKDKNGCGITNKTIYLLMYPKFFTPNNDGINDKWFIKNSSTEPNMELFIYNRYGKLLKQISSQGEGWDGTLNGSQLQADDYWFIVKRENGKEFKGHFSLKR
jgi:gliding motility-associated-like protein